MERTARGEARPAAAVAAVPAFPGGLGERFEAHKAWIAAVSERLAPCGSMWVCAGPDAFLANAACQALGAQVLNEVVLADPETGRFEKILWARPAGASGKCFFGYAYSKEGDFPEDALKKPGKQMRTVWGIGREGRQALFERLIRLASPDGAAVLCPFPSDSVRRAARNLGRPLVEGLS